MRSELFDIMLNNEVMTAPRANKIHGRLRIIIQGYTLPLSLQLRLQNQCKLLWMIVSPGVYPTKLTIFASANTIIRPSDVRTRKETCLDSNISNVVVWVVAHANVAAKRLAQVDGAAPDQHNTLYCQQQ